MQASKRLVRRGIVILAAVCLTMWASPARAQDPDTEFRNGVSAFEQGRFEEAEAHFTNVLKARPDHETALRYRDEAGYRFWVQVLARGGRLATVAERLLKAAEQGAVRERQDEEKLRQELNGLWSDDFMERIVTTERIIAKYGHYVVPLLVDVLKDRHEDERRITAIQLLARLGDEGTLAVIELLEAEGDLMLQQNAAAILGHTKDVRAIPPLKRLAERTQDPHVKQAAQKAIQAIGDPGFPTAEAFARVADAFYREHPLFLGNRYHEHVVWKWQQGRLTRRTVPRFRWNEEIAEEYAYDGLSVAPDDEVLWATLLNIYAQQYTEIEESLRVAQQITDRGGEVDEDALEQMRDMQSRLAKVKMLVASRGPEALLAGLGKALADQRAPVAVFLIERLQELELDDAFLATGGPVSFLPEPERKASAAASTPAPAPRPAARPAPASSSTPTPTRVEDRPRPAPANDDAPSLDDDDAPTLDDDDAPSLDDDQPRRRPRRVSQGAQRDGRVLAFRQSSLASQSFSANPLAGRDDQVMTGGQALSAALTYGDKRVRYAAAIALAHLNPKASFSGANEVMTNLVDALGESGQRVVLVVERDRHHRNQLVGMLRDLGYMTFGLAGGREGLARARAFPSHDLVIVSTELNTRTLEDEVEPRGDEPLAYQFIDELRADYRTAPVKVMVLTPEERESEMQSLVDDGRALDVLTPAIDRATLADKLSRAFGSEADQRDEKSRSDAVAERAARAIASLDRRHSQFDISAAATALSQNVRRDAGRPDAVRLACLEAISAIGPAASGPALEVMVREFRDETNSIELRRALPRAIGDVLRGSAVSDDVFQALLGALAHSDEGVWEAAGYALGKAKLTGAQALAVFEAQRLE